MKTRRHRTPPAPDHTAGALWEATPHHVPTHLSESKTSVTDTLASAPPGNRRAGAMPVSGHAHESNHNVTPQANSRCTRDVSTRMGLFGDTLRLTGYSLFLHPHLVQRSTVARVLPARPVPRNMAYGALLWPAILLGQPHSPGTASSCRKQVSASGRAEDQLAPRRSPTMAPDIGSWPPTSGPGQTTDDGWYHQAAAPKGVEAP